MLAEENKAANIPAHDKHTDRNTDNGCTESIDITQIFRRQGKVNLRRMSA